MITTVRDPAVAGQFYTGSRDSLLKEVLTYTQDRTDTIRALGCVVPHAGYMYSGHVAGAVYAHLELPKKFVILCPNHTGMGKPLALMSEGRWRTPLGEVSVDEELSNSVIDACPHLQSDPIAHVAEHAIEVQLPFLQALSGPFQFVPITVGTGNFETLVSLGKAIGEVVSRISERVLVIASSDMNHYESDALTRVKDRKAIERVLELDPAGLYDIVHREKISMCGYGPTVAMLTAVRRLGATSADLIKYATSGDVSGDRTLVVGYAGIAIS